MSGEPPYPNMLDPFRDQPEPPREWKMFGQHPHTNMAGVAALLTALASVANSYTSGHPFDWTTIGLAVSAAYGLFAAADAKKGS